MKYTRDGVLALLPSAASAIQAAQAIRNQLLDYGMHIRAGVHLGDEELRGDDVSGIAVNVAARIMNHATADETLVSEPVRRATLGSGNRFVDTRTAELKGVPERWTMYRWQPATPH